ncbi:MAG: hypothetical protein KQH59_18160 [Desulfobulbaceae bacterium]|nr:hypothetical protein [Desulfobulbaceae bacterium]
MKLNAFTIRDLYRMRALTAEATAGGLSLDGLDGELATEIRRRSAEPGPMLPAGCCPSCLRGRLVVSRHGDVRYEICVNGNGKAGCGWSRMI